MSITCKIEFVNNSHSIFVAGQCLRGTVRLTMHDGKNVRGIYIRIGGEAYCRWTRTTNTYPAYRNTSHRHHLYSYSYSYTGQEDYLNEITYLIGGEHGDLIH